MIELHFGLTMLVACQLVDTMAEQYKLTYFNLQGLAEVSRLLLKYGRIEFEDFRLEFDQWPEFKPKMPFGQAPLLTVNGKEFTQSISIARYFAKKVKLVGKDDLEDMEIDSIIDTIYDLRNKLALYSYEKDPAIKESRKDSTLNEIMPFYLKKLDTIAKENNGHLACKKLTWADMYFAGIYEYLNWMAGVDVVAGYPNLSIVLKNVLTIPAIADWVKIRPKTMF